MLTENVKLSTDPNDNVEGRGPKLWAHWALALRAHQKQQGLGS